MVARHRVVASPTRSWDRRSSSVPARSPARRAARARRRACSARLCAAVAEAGGAAPSPSSAPADCPSTVGSRAAPWRPTSAHSRVPPLRATPQRRETASTRSPEPAHRAAPLGALPHGLFGPVRARALSELPWIPSTARVLPGRERRPVRRHRRDAHRPHGPRVRQRNRPRPRRRDGGLHLRARTESSRPGPRPDPARTTSPAPQTKGPAIAGPPLYRAAVTASPTPLRSGSRQRCRAHRSECAGQSVPCQGGKISLDPGVRAGGGAGPAGRLGRGARMRRRASACALLGPVGGGSGRVGSRGAARSVIRSAFQRQATGALQDDGL